MSRSVGLNAVFTATDRTSGVVGRIQASVLGFTGRAGKSLASLDRINGKIADSLKATAIALGGVGLAAGAVAKNVIGTGADFEQAMSAVGAVSLQTREQIAPLEKQALELGASTVFSATQVANAMETMARAGFKNQEIMAGVPGVLDAAAASGLEIAEVAGVVSNALKGMGLAANQASRVADVLALASARTNSTIGTLGESMKNLAPVARQLNIPFEQAVASVALLQDVGLDASEAGTATATMLTKLAAPSKEVAAQMRALGISFEDAKGNALGLPEILGNFDKAAKKTGGNMKVLGFFSELVGLRGQKAALNLKDLFASGKLSTLTTELEGAAGSAGKMAALRLDNFKGDVEQLGGALDTLKIGLFSMQSGPLRGLVQSMTQWVTANQELIKTKVGEAITKWVPIVIEFGKGVADAFGAALPVAKGFASALTSLFGDKSKSEQEQARAWGETIAKWGIRWLEFSAALKVARGTIFLIEGVTKASKVASWMWEVGKSTKAAVDAFRVAAQVGPSSMVAMSNAINGFGGEVGTAAASVGRLAGMRGAVNMFFSSFIAQAGLAAAAAGAVYLAVDQGQKFLAENGGWEGVKGFFGQSDVSNNWGFAGVNDVQNDQARKEAAQRRSQEPAPPPLTPKQQAVADVFSRYGTPPPGGAGNDWASAFGAPPRNPPGPGVPAPAAPPPAAARPAISPAELQAAVSQSLEVTLKVPEAVTAEVTKRPKGAKVNMQPSGGL